MPNTGAARTVVREGQTLSITGLFLIGPEDPGTSGQLGTVEQGPGQEACGTGNELPLPARRTQSLFIRFRHLRKWVRSGTMALLDSDGGTDGRMSPYRTALGLGWGDYVWVSYDSWDGAAPLRQMVHLPARGGAGSRLYGALSTGAGLRGMGEHADVCLVGPSGSRRDFTTGTDTMGPTA